MLYFNQTVHQFFREYGVTRTSNRHVCCAHSSIAHSIYFIQTFDHNVGSILVLLWLLVPDILGNLIPTIMYSFLKIC